MCLERRFDFGAKGVKNPGLVGLGLKGDDVLAVDFFTELKAVYVDYTGRKRESNIY